MAIKVTTTRKDVELVDPIDKAKADELARLEEEKKRFTGKVRIIRTIN